MTSYLLAGTPSDLGLALVSHLLSFPDTCVKNVFVAEARSTNNSSLVSLANDPRSAGRLILIVLNVKEHRSVQHAVATVVKVLGPDSGLGVLISNFNTVTEDARILDMSEDKAIEMFQLNTIGTQRVLKAFLPLLRKGGTKRIVGLTTSSSSLTSSIQPAEADSCGYTISKTATNMLILQWAAELSNDGFTVVSLYPEQGSVANTAAQEAQVVPLAVTADAIVSRIENLSVDQNGKLLPVNIVEP